MATHNVPKSKEQIVTQRWLEIIKPPKPIEEIHGDYKLGLISDNELVSAAWSERLVQFYSWTFWRNHQSVLTQQVKNLDREDIKQICKMSIVPSFDRYDPARWRRSIIFYLTMRMFNDCQDEVRRNKPCGRLSDLQIVHTDDLVGRDLGLYNEAEQDNEDDMDAVLVKSELFTLVNQLGGTYERVITLYYVQGLTDAEIGAELRPHNPYERSTVGRWRHQALDCLRDKFGVPRTERPVKRLTKRVGSGHSNGNGYITSPLFPDVKIRPAKFSLTTK